MTTDIFSVFSKGQVLTPADGKAYEESLHRWADNAVRRAKFVVFPHDAQEVGKAIRYAVDNNLELAIKGGGHSTSGASSSEGLVIDLKHLNTVSIDTEKRLISVGGGCIWADVDREAAKYGLATVGGTVNHTGVGGLTVGGGYGWLTAKYGLTIDNLVQAEVVLANGSVVTCSQTEHSDLFWGIRGAGSNFGPVTKFVLKGYPQPNKVWSGMVVYHPSKLAEVIDAAREWLGSVGEDESAMIIFSQYAGNPVVVLSPFYNGPAEEGRQKFAKFLAIEHIADQTQERPYEEQNSLQNAMTTHGDRKVLRAAPFVTLDTELSKHVFGEFVKMTAAEPDFKASAVIIELHPHHKISKVPVSATAFANRGPYFSWTFITRFTNPALDDTARAWSKDIAKHIRVTDAKLSGLDLDGTRGYSNYGLDDESVQSVFGENYGRLTELKAKYDPGMVFRKWLPIVPKGGKAAA